MDLPSALTPDDIRGLTITQLDAFLDLVAATVLADGQISEGERVWVEQRLVHGAFAGTDTNELYRHLDMSLNHYKSHGQDLAGFVQMAKAQLAPFSPQLAEKILLALVQISESDKQTAEAETAVVRAVSAALGVAKERMSIVVGAATGAVIFPPITRGDLATVKLLLDNGTAVDTRDHNQWTPLHVAVATGQEAIVELLLERGAPVDALHAQGSTPLFCGCNKPYATIVKKLLAKGANANAQNAQTGLTPLAVAVMFGQDEVVAALLAGGARPQLAAPDDGKTPLHHAAEGDRTSIAKLLVASGADINAPDASGATPIHRAAMNCPQTLAALLAAPGRDVDRQTGQGVTPLAGAAREGFTTCVQLLLDANARVDLANVQGGTPMFLATIHRRRDVHDLLAARGAQPAGTVSQAKEGPLELMEWRAPQIAIVPVAQALASYYAQPAIDARLLRAIAEHRTWFALDRTKAPDGSNCLFVFSGTDILSPFILANMWVGNAGVRQLEGTEIFSKLEGVDVVGVDMRAGDDAHSIVLRGENIAKLGTVAAAVVVERAIATQQLTRTEAAVAARYFGYTQVMSTTNNRPIGVNHPMGRLFVPIYTADDTFAAAPSAPGSTTNTVGKQIFDIAALDCDGAIVNPFGPTIPKILSLEAAAKLFAG